MFLVHVRICSSRTLFPAGEWFLSNFVSLCRLRLLARYCSVLLSPTEFMCWFFDLHVFPLLFSLFSTNLSCGTWAYAFFLVGEVCFRRQSACVCLSRVVSHCQFVGWYHFSFPQTYALPPTKNRTVYVPVCLVCVCLPPFQLPLSHPQTGCGLGG